MTFRSPVGARACAVATLLALSSVGSSPPPLMGGCAHLNLGPTVVSSMSIPGTPVGVAADDAGHLVVATSEGQVHMLSTIGNCTVLNSVALPAGTGSPVAITANLVGDIYVATSTGSVFRLNTGLAVLATQTVAGTPVDIAVDIPGSVYILTSTGTIHKRTADLAALSSGTVTGTPSALFATITGDIYVTTSGGAVHRLNSISLMTLSSGTVTGTPIDVSADAAGNVIVGTSGGGLFKISPTITVLASRTGIPGPLVGVDLDDAGHVVTASASGAVHLTNTGLTTLTTAATPGPARAILITTTADIFVVGGTGTPPAPVAAFSASALTIAPNPVIAGNTGTAAAIVSNSGTAPLSITAVTITSPDPGSPWSLAPMAPFPITVNAGGPNATFTARLAVPAALAADRAYQATMTITSNDPTTPSKVIPITGNGDAQLRQACYSALMPFGDVNTGSAATRSFTVTNCGDLPLHIQSATLTPVPAGSTVWSVTPTVPPVVTLAVGAARQFTVTLTVPGGLTADESYGLDIAITTDDQVNPTIRHITASGTGHVPVARLVIDPEYWDIDYRTVELGYHFSRPLVVRNTGDLALTFDVTHVNPTDPTWAEFTLETDAVTFQIPPGGVRTFRQTFAPGSLGPKSVTVHFGNTNAANVTSLDVIHHGAGTPPVPIDVALVLDRSGSMGSTAGEIVKIEALRRSGILFAELLRDGIDWFGLTKYDDQNSNILPLGPIATNRTTAEGLLNDINNMSGIAPRGTTGIGGAMRTATLQYALQPDPTHRKVMIVLTDGIENEDPRIRDVLNGDGSHQPLFTEFPDLLAYSLGLGLEGNISADRLQEISNRGVGGTYHVTGDLTGLSLFNLENYFFKIFADAVGQQIVRDPTFSVALGGTLDEPIPMITEDREALFFFVGELPQQAYVFELVDPTGQVMSSSATVGGMSVHFNQMNNWTLVRVVFPPPDISRDYVGDWHFRAWIANPGQWTGAQTQTHALPGSKTFGVGGNHRMSIAASVGSSYRLGVGLSPGVVLPGDPITMRATLADGGWPAPDATVTVTIRRPDGSIASTTLFDDGAHGDGAAHDAAFSGTFSATGLRGVYQFHFVSSGVTERGETVTREALRSQYVGAPSPDPTPAPCLPCWLVRVLIIVVIVILVAVLMILRRRP